MKHLLRESYPGNHLWASYYSRSAYDGYLSYANSHLESFMGGNWLLGAQLLSDTKLFDLGLRLVDSAWHSYNATATGIGPESWRFIPKQPPPGKTLEDLLAGLSDKERAMLYKLDYFSYEEDVGGDSVYILRPEVLESQFYAWRTTGDVKYQERVWQAFQSLKKYCVVVDKKKKVAGGTRHATTIAGINDVQSRNTTKRSDATESFFYAELAKYIYLTFADPSLANLDDYVFNTEAHPFKATPATKDLAATSSIDGQFTSLHKLAVRSFDHISYNFLAGSALASVVLVFFGILITRRLHQQRTLKKVVGRIARKALIWSGETVEVVQGGLLNRRESRQYSQDYGTYSRSSVSSRRD